MRLKRMGALKGLPDLLVLRDSKLHGLELKRRGGRLSAAQVATHRCMREAGANIATVFDVDAAVDQLSARGLLR
jgi:hypothetical protein